MPKPQPRKPYQPGQGYGKCLAFWAILFLAGLVAILMLGRA